MKGKLTAVANFKKLTFRALALRRNKVRDCDSPTEEIKVRDRIPHTSLIPKVIRHKLFLDSRYIRSSVDNVTLSRVLCECFRTE